MFRRFILAAAALLLAGLANAAIADALIQKLVVKWRDDAVPASVQSLSAQQTKEFADALQIPFSIVGRTGDGAFQVELLTPLAVDEARTALNRVRMLPTVLYGNLVPAAQFGAGVATAAKPTLSGPPVRRLIVKYRDFATTLAAAQNRPLSGALLSQLSTSAGQPVEHLRAMSGGAYVVRLSKPLAPDAAQALADHLASDPGIEYAYVDAMKKPSLVPNDPLYALQWHYQSPPAEPAGVNLPPAWNTTTGSSGIFVAVIDTGILPHPDLSGRYVGGYDMISDCAVANDSSAACTFSPLPYNPANPPAPSFNSRDSNPADPGDWVTAQESSPPNPPPPPYYDWFAGCGASNSSWHGTHVAGTIAAASNNAMGVAGINWVGQIVPIRVLGKCGGYDSDIIDAIVWAVGGAVPGVPANPNPVRVINMSFGGPGACSTASQNAINTALNAGAVLAVAAGNGNVDASSSSPANCNGVITVAALARSGQRAFYSNFGPLVEIAAPGGGAATSTDLVLSTLNDGATSPDPTGYNYVYYAGTSMATPHVAGIASLMLSVNPALTPAQVLAKIQTTARAFPFFSSGGCSTSGATSCGAGIIDAGAAVQAALPANTPTATALLSGNNPSIVGSPVTFYASVSGTAPTGTVNFKDGANSIGGCSAVTLSFSNAQCTTTALVVGSHSISATYGGDAHNAGSTSTTLSQVVNKATSFVSLSSFPNPSMVGVSVTFTATVTSPMMPTGTVSFTDGGNSLPGCAALALGPPPQNKPACVAGSLSQGTHSIVAIYSGDANNAAAQSTALSQVVNAGSGGGPSVNVALAANGGVASASSSSYPAGAVNNGDRAGLNFSGGGVWMDATPGLFPDWVEIDFNGLKPIDRVIVYSAQDNFSAPVDPSDTLTFTKYGITAFDVQVWNGGGWLTLGSVSGNNLVKRSVALGGIMTSKIRVLINAGRSSYSMLAEIEAWTTSGGGSAPVATTTTISSSANPVDLGGTVILTATVTGSNPTGNVSFTDSGSGLGYIFACLNSPLIGSGNTKTATCQVYGINAFAQSRQIAAKYAGDANNAASASAPLLQVVSATPAFATTSSLASSPNPSQPGANVTFTVNVNGSAPTGTVDMSLSGVALPSCVGLPLTGSGDTRSAQCATNTLPIGSSTINAIYYGDGANTSSSSNVTQVVSGTTTILGSSPNPSTVGGPVQFTATVSGPGNPTGSVNFLDGASSIAGCSAAPLAPVTGGSQAQCATTTLAQGTHTITANYSGDANNPPSQSAPVSQIVNGVSGGPSINVALAVNGGVASASSSSYPASAVNNGDRAGLNFTGGGVWMDATPGLFPDWIEIDFNGPKTIDHVIVYSAQDKISSPVDPPDTLTFTRYGVTAFDVQSWNGSAWVTLGSVTGNNLVKRSVAFAATTTSKIRVVINAAKNSYSMLAEIEAWTH